MSYSTSERRRLIILFLGSVSDMKRPPVWDARQLRQFALSALTCWLTVNLVRGSAPVLRKSGRGERYARVWDEPTRGRFRRRRSVAVNLRRRPDDIPYPYW